MGWGEFEITARIYFIDPQEDSIDLTMNLRLFPDEDAQLSTKTPVITEQKDDIIFADPSLAFYRCLLKGPVKEAPRTDFSATEEDEMMRIKRAHDHVKEQIANVSLKLAS